MALLEVEGLNVEIAGDRGRARVLDHVDFALERGRSLGIVGESGCGKSMTALAVMGLLPEAARAGGRIRFAGEDLLGLDEKALCAIRGRRIAMVFQEPMTALNPVKSIGVQVAEGLRRHLGLGRTEAEGRAVALLERVGLPSRRFPPGLYPHQLSGGQRQRVVIAMALACGPDLLIADEPTTALDVTIQAQILDLIAEVVAEAGMALMLITHDLGVVWENTEEMIVMYAGRVVERGATEEVFRRMSHPYTRGLFAAQPGAVEEAPGGSSLGPGRTRLATIPGQVPDPADLPAGCVFAARCPRADDICRREAPPEAVIVPGHVAACHHPVPEGDEAS
ncbi:MAG: ABC transporter ATP-binding protein [Rhodospirillales bacterium]|nr:ABC transporter ATP-binding protein [Rhodospirillales bacterium]MDH3791287.1 ABC transporter ATP-binding protein [Rhodospirillales bacterium]MDH3911290.1 ABC transporter ATP-binding protein [Rhodospirillales bacterium]MDH3917050.1 ABC transporter ATP-binding protein [Rhodospirillales bacterium]MDH3968020.1 ABC transporter ATP-binding protein [Rhodospirillales bacterium]